MSSQPDLSRLSTDGGIRYAIVEGYPKFSFDANGAKATEKLVLHASNMQSFIDEAFPGPRFQGNFIMPGLNRRLPGNSFFIAKGIDAEPVDMSRPWDPYGVDSGATEKTYSELCHLTISYETTENEDNDDPDPEDPQTFLTHSLTLGGEFLALNCPNCNWLPQDRNGGVPNPAISEHPEFMDPLNLPGAVPVEGDKEPNKDFQIPITKVIPMIEHTLAWREVVDPPWQAIRGLLGKVNDRQSPLFFNAPAETVLFLGVSAKQEFTARRNVPIAFRKPWSMDFKFSEKHAEDTSPDGKAIVIGWNHLWRPEKGRWDILLRKPNDDRLYQSNNFEYLFRRGWEPNVGAGGPIPS